MKRYSLTSQEINALEDAIVEFGSVVTFEQLSSLFDEKREYTRKRISKLVNQGWLKRIKRGVFVMSDLSTRGVLSISTNAIVNHLVKESYISFESALQYHGIYDQLLTGIRVISLKQTKDKLIDHTKYQFIKTQEKYFYGWEEKSIDGQTVKVATIEKALIDLIQYSRSRYSTDLVIEKLLDNSSAIDFERLIEFAKQSNLTTQRIIGFLLDLANRNSSNLRKIVENRQSNSTISKEKKNLYNNKWKLYYDQYFEKYIL